MFIVIGSQFENATILDTKGSEDKIAEALLVTLVTSIVQILNWCQKTGRLQNGALLSGE